MKGKHLFSVVKSLVMDQAGCLEDTPLLPQRLLGRETASLSPFRRSPRFHRGSLPLLLGLAPCDRGDVPPRLPQLICGKPQISKSGSIAGFALLSLRSRNHARSAFHTVFSTPSLIHFIPRICGCFRMKVFQNS